MTDALEIRNLTKRFECATALDGVSLTVARGAVHGLLGSNGSGKSTLIKVLADFHDPEPGAEIRLYDARLALPVTGAEARRRGLAFVHQNLGLIPSLSVAETSTWGGSRPAPTGRWTGARSTREPATRSGRFGLALDLRAEVAALSAVEQALLAIVRSYEDIRHEAEDHADRPGCWSSTSRRRSCRAREWSSFST